MLKIFKDKWYLFLIAFLVGIGLLILYVYLVATKTWLFDLSSKGELGDAINGIISPVIGLIGIALLGLSFFVQYLVISVRPCQAFRSNGATLKDAAKY
ncbi:MAG: hypothetical protein IH947_16160 [Bacteroidetes bacterium]|nr:hypothetical protein [Bacteroidota bacterium]